MPVRKSVRRVVPILLIAALTLAACNMGATPPPTFDVNAINTAAFNTAAAQISAGQTQTALVAPLTTPTNTTAAPATVAVSGDGTVLPTAAGAFPTVSFNTTPTTPLAGLTPLVTSIAPTTSAGIGNTASGCNDGSFVGETLPDKSVVGAGKDFSKAWELKNTGTCAWEEGYAFAFQGHLSSAEIEGYDIVIKASDEVTKPGHTQTFIVKLTAPTAAGEYKGYWKLKDKSGVLFGPLVFFDIVVK